MECEQKKCYSSRTWPIKKYLLKQCQLDADGCDKHGSHMSKVAKQQMEGAWERALNYHLSLRKIF